MVLCLGLSLALARSLQRLRAALAAIALQWRRFPFFDKELLTEEEAKDRPLKLFETFDSTCATSGRGHLAFGDATGQVRVVNRDFQAASFPAHEGAVIALVQLKRSAQLVSLGLDGDEPTLKVWRVDKPDPEGRPTLAKQLKVFTNAKLPRAAVTALAVLEDLTQIALGFHNGMVVVFDGNLVRDRQPRQSLLVREGGPPVTGLHYREDGKQVALFVVSTEAVKSILSKERDMRLTELEPEGAAPLCSTVNEDKFLVVARPSAVYFYDAEERGICFGFEGAKRAIGCFGPYLWVIDDDADGRALASFAAAAGNAGAAASASAPAASPRPAAADPAPFRIKSGSGCRFTIYDLKNRLIAFQSKFESVVEVVAEWGSLYVVTGARQVFQLSEKDLASKMKHLFKKNLYSVAINLANTQKCDENYIKEINQMYGDHLCSKGDFDAAILQYIETIPYVEPSYVIRKFLDAQRIHNLTRYLQALHEKGKANENHTTLLLNCYTKLKDVAKLNEFVRSESGFTFDVKTAIQVCRQAQYFENALELAERHGEHELFLKMVLEDLGDTKRALDYLWRLDYDDADRFMRDHGKRLVTALPAEATELLKALCTSYAPRRPAAAAPSAGALRVASAAAAEEKKGPSPPAPSAAQPPAPPAPPAPSPPVFASAAAVVKESLAKVGLGLGGGRGGSDAHPTPSQPIPVPGAAAAPAPAASGASLTSTSATAGSAAAAAASAAAAAVAVAPSATAATSGAASGARRARAGRSRAEDFIHLFVDIADPRHLRGFLQHVVDNEAAGAAASSTVYDTLLDLYLKGDPEGTVRAAAAADGDGESKEEGAATGVAAGSARHPYREQIMRLLKSKADTYNVENALVLTKLWNFEPGVLFLYEQLRLTTEIVEHHMAKRNYDAIIKACSKYGDQDAQLWVMALGYFANQPRCDRELTQVLQRVEDKNLLPPLRVVQVLAASSTKTLEVVKDYIVRTLQRETQAIEQDQRDIRSYQEQTSDMRDRLAELRSQARTFQETKCQVCAQQLELPAVHFLCGHSFHVRCLGDNDAECVRCAPEFHQKRQMLRQMRAAASNHDQFFKQLEDARDGFETVAEYFSRGTFQEDAPDAAKP